MTENAIRHIAVSREGDLFATGAFERIVTVWSYPERRKIAELETHMDFGGRRLAIVGGTRPRLLAGAYHRYGIACYDPLAGSRLWERRDLKRVQTVSACGETRVCVVGLDSRPAHALDIDTGHTIALWRGAGKGHAHSDLTVLISKRLIVCLDQDGQVKWRARLPEELWGALDVAVGKPGITVAFAREGLVTFEATSGHVLWHLRPPEGEHYLRVSWCERDDCFYAVQWSYLRSGPYSIVAISAEGRHEQRVGILRAGEVEFWKQGTAVVSSDGHVRDTLTLRSLWHFRP